MKSAAERAGPNLRRKRVARKPLLRYYTNIRKKVEYVRYFTTNN